MWTCQDGGALGLVGERDLHLAVEASRSQQGGVEDLGPVGGGDDDDARARFESVHLRQELVEGLLALVVGHDGPAPALADGVDLVDEDDRRSPLAGIGEEVADPGRPHPDEQLHEARTGEGEEGDLGLAGHGSGHERLARARGPDHEDPARAYRTGLGVALGVLQEVDDLDDLALGPVVAGHVGEPGRGTGLVVDLGLRSPDAHDPARQLLAGAATDPQEDPDEEQEREEGQQGRRRGSRAIPPR